MPRSTKRSNRAQRRSSRSRKRSSRNKKVRSKRMRYRSATDEKTTALTGKDVTDFLLDDSQVEYLGDKIDSEEEQKKFIEKLHEFKLTPDEVNYVHDNAAERYMTMRSKLSRAKQPQRSPQVVESTMFHNYYSDGSRERIEPK